MRLGAVGRGDSGVYGVVDVQMTAPGAPGVAGGGSTLTTINIVHHRQAERARARVAAEDGLAAYTSLRFLASAAFVSFMFTCISLIDSCFIFRAAASRLNHK
jgi:hypothetical protein